MSYRIPEVALMQLKEETAKGGGNTFLIEPLAPGFGLTLGNALRRILLSSLPGAAITSIRIEGVNHEFSTIAGVVQDAIDIILNLKQVRFRLDGDEPQTIVLDIKGAKKATAADFRCPTGVTVVNKDQFIAETLSKGKLLLEATVERGRGYLPTEQRRDDKLPIGVIAIDAAFSPVTRVNFQTEHTRVGKMTNFDRLVLEIETDKTISPREALLEAAAILVEYFSLIVGGSFPEAASTSAAAVDEKADSVQQGLKTKVKTVAKARVKASALKTRKTKN